MHHDQDFNGRTRAPVERVICLGDITAGLEEHLFLCMEALKVSLDMLKSGVSPYDIWAASNAFMRKHCLREEGKSQAHGMGYDMGERPSIDQGETMKIQDHFWYIFSIPIEGEAKDKAHTIYCMGSGIIRKFVELTGNFSS